MPLYRCTERIRSIGKDLKGRSCRIIARGKGNAVRVKFIDTGQEEIVSRRSLRKVSLDLANQRQAGINRFRFQRGF